MEIDLVQGQEQRSQVGVQGKPEGKLQRKREVKRWKKARKNLLTRKALRETSMCRMTDPRAKGKEIPKHILFVGDRAIWPKTVVVQHR